MAITVQDAAVPVAGTVLSRSDKFVFEDGKRTNQLRRVDFTVQFGDGFAVISFDAGEVPVSAEVGSHLAVLGRPVSWARGEGSATVRYHALRPLSGADLDAIAEFVG